MEIHGRSYYTLDARQKVDWVDEVLEQIQRFYMTNARELDQIEITQEQMDDLRRRFPSAYTHRSGRSPGPALWGVPLVVRDR